MDSLQRCNVVFFAEQLSAVCLLKPSPHCFCPSWNGFLWFPGSTWLTASGLREANCLSFSFLNKGLEVVSQCKFTPTHGAGWFLSAHRCAHAIWSSCECTFHTSQRCPLHPVHICPLTYSGPRISIWPMQFHRIDLTMPELRDCRLTSIAFQDWCGPSLFQCDKQVSFHYLIF